MKIKVTYTRKADGKVEALLRCMDRGSFPYSSIFPSNFDAEEIEKLTTLNNEYSYAYIVDDPDKIEAKVERIINKIKELLEEWKQIAIPADKEYIYLY